MDWLAAAQALSERSLTVRPPICASGSDLRLLQSGQPIRRRPAIIVGERDEIRLRGLDTQVTRGCGPAVVLPDHLHKIPEGRGHRGQRGVAAVVDDDHADARVLQGGEAFQAHPQMLRPVAGRDDHGAWLVQVNPSPSHDLIIRGIDTKADLHGLVDALDLLGR